MGITDTYKAIGRLVSVQNLNIKEIRDLNKSTIHKDMNFKNDYSYLKNIDAYKPCQK